MNAWLRACDVPKLEELGQQGNRREEATEEVWQKDRGDHPQVKGPGFKLQGKEVGPHSVLKEIEASLTWGFLEGGGCGLQALLGVGWRLMEED